MKSFDSIKWHESKPTAIRQCATFMIKVLNHFDIKLDKNPIDPISVAKKFINKEISYEEYRINANFYWEKIDSNDSIREFNNNTLNDRISISLLSVENEDFNELSNHLSWFVQLMGMYGKNEDEIIYLAQEYFIFE